MQTKDSFDFIPSSGTSRMDLMDQAGGMNERTFVMGGLPDLADTGAQFDGTQVGSEGYMASDYPDGVI